MQEELGETHGLCYAAAPYDIKKQESSILSRTATVVA